MHKRRVLYFMDPEIHSILLRRLSDKGYRIYPKVRLGDAIGKDADERLPAIEFDYLTRAHLDFLVVKDEMPVFAVEFDGLQHFHDPKTIERDVLKNRLCKAADLPLLRITVKEVTERDQWTLLDYMLLRFLAWHDEIDDISSEIQDFADTLPPDADVEDYAVDLDPTVQFDLRHPFPGTRLVTERLWHRYHIAWNLDEDRSRHSSAVLICSAFMHSSGALHHDQFHTSQAKAAVWKPGAKENEIIFSEVVEVTMRSWLPLIADVPEPPDLDLFSFSNPGKSRSDLERFKLRAESMWFPQLPGMSIWDISEQYAEYLGFRAIERWAKNTLHSSQHPPTRR